ncbi:MAG: hypothetical protein ACK4MM_01665 [Fervidobacterium sp.]
MRITREIIETLKIELGFIKFHKTELELKSKLDNIDVLIKLNIDGFSFTPPTIFDVTFQRAQTTFFSVFLGKNISIKNSEFSSSNLAIYSPEIELNIQVNEKNLAENNFFENQLSVIDLGQKESASLNVIKNLSYISSINKLELNFPSLKVCSKNCIIKNVNLVNFPFKASLKDVEFIKIRSISPISRKTIHFKSNTFPMLYRAYINPQDYVEKDILLQALTKLRENYDITKVKFYAYYKNIPFEMVKNIRINNSKKLVIYFEKSKVIVKPKELRNLLVFKYEEKFLYFSL